MLVADGALLSSGSNQIMQVRVSDDVFCEDEAMQVDNAVEKTKQAVNKGADAVENAIDDVADKATNATRKARAATEDALDQGQDALEGALRCASEIVRTHPLTSVAVVGAIAYLWGRLR